jgi:hypothetical protein
VKDSLESIALIDLVQISENGLGHLTDLKYVDFQFEVIFIEKCVFFRNLKQIDLARLPGIKNRQGIIKVLKNELPKCTVNYDDNYPPAPELEEK